MSLTIEERLERLEDLLGVGETPPAAEHRPPSPSGAGGDFRAAVVVGHNSASRGAQAGDPLNKSEWQFNLSVAELMEGASVKLFMRGAGLAYHEEIDDVYGRVDAWGADVSVELHFNAAIPAARGTETLSSGSRESLKLARIFQDAMVKTLGLPDRGVKVKSRNERGGRSLHAGKAPAVLVEPFFGTNRQDCKVAESLGVDGFAAMYLKALKAYQND